MKYLFIFIFILSVNIHAMDWAIIVHKSNSMNSISQAELKRMLLKQQLFWKNGTKVVPLIFSNKSVHFEQFTKDILGFTIDEYTRYWIEQRYISRQSPPKDLDFDILPKMGSVFMGLIMVLPSDKFKKNNNLKIIKLK